MRTVTKKKKKKEEPSLLKNGEVTRFKLDYPDITEREDLIPLPIDGTPVAVPAVATVADALDKVVIRLLLGRTILLPYLVPLGPTGLKGEFLDDDGDDDDEDKVLISILPPLLLLTNGFLEGVRLNG
jgi:hypothetical protein